MRSRDERPGRAHVDPPGACAGQWGTWTLRYTAGSAGDLDAVEVVRLGCTRDIDPTVLRRWEPGGADLVALFVDDQELARPTLYYTRMAQHRPYRGRIPMAWSSIWVDSQ